MGLVLGLGVAALVSASTSNVPQKGGGTAPPPSTGTWVRTTNIPSLGLGVPLLLTDGSVLCHAPQSRNWRKLTPDAFGSYQNGTWSTVAQLPSGYGPLYYASAVLADGRVVVIGGEYNAGQSGGVWTNKGAWYDPQTNVWTNLAAPTGWANVGDAQCSVMPDGKFFLAMPFDTRMASLDPATMTWTPLQSTGKTDRHDEEGWTLMPDGTLLTVCAINAPTCQKYIPWDQQWVSAGSTPQRLEDPGSQEIGPAVLMPDGTVFATGATGHNAIYHPGQFPTDPGTWTSAPDFPIGPNGQLDIADGPAVLLPNGNVLCYCSPGIFNSPSSFFEFDGTSMLPVTDVANNAGNPSFVGNFLMLPNGQVLFTDFSNDVQVYTPVGGPQEAWRPTIAQCPTQVAAGQTFILRGTQLNGLSQCSVYGDDSANSTNYPLVRIRNLATNHVKYCRTHDHSTMAVATGSQLVATRVDVPAGIEAGPSVLEVAVNGIASQPMNVTVVASKVAGHVNLGDWSVSTLYTPVTVEIRTPGSTVAADTQTILLDQSGNFQIATTLPAGLYDITVKAGHWLRAKLANQTLTAAGISGLTFSLLNGDVNGDNVVSLADFAQIRAAFGATNTTGPEDLNGDGNVSLADFTILRANFGQVGAP